MNQRLAAFLGGAVGIWPADATRVALKVCSAEAEQIWRVTQGWEVGPSTSVGGGPSPCRNFALASEEAAYSRSTKGLGRDLGLLP